MSAPPKKTSVSALTRHVQVAVFLGWLVLFVFVFHNRHEFTLENIMDLSPEDMLPAALMMLLLFAIKSVSVIFYCGILFAASGILFPLPLAFAINLVGAVIIVTLPYCLGRCLGTEGAAALLQKYPKLQILREFRSDNAVLFPFLIQATGICPSDPFSMYMGAVGAHYGKYLLGSLLGYMFDLVPYTVMGFTVEDPDSPAFLIALGVRVTATLCAVFTVWRRKKAHNKG